MRACLSILFGKEAIGLMVLTGAFFGCRYVASSANPDPIAFKDAQALKEFAVAQGLAYHSGNAHGHDGNAGGGYFLADQPITFEDVVLVSDTRHCGLTPQWHGILWVSSIHGPSATLCPEHVGGTTRVWGNVLVAGDEAMIDRIEALYRSRGQQAPGTE